MLVPATAEDLKSAGKVTVSPSVNSKDGEPVKAVQIKVSYIPLEDLVCTEPLN
jgi:hypothetical protein